MMNVPFSPSHMLFFSLMIMTSNLLILAIISCFIPPSLTKEQRFIFYDVNPGEGFNLRRDVFIRMAVMVHKLNLQSSKFSYTLVSFYLVAREEICHRFSNSGFASLGTFVSLANA